MIIYGMRIDRDGPLFDGRAALAAAGYADEIEQVIAEVGVHKARTRMSQHFVAPTGWYESHVRADKMFDGWEIHDSGIVYGPWLAGIGSRNRPRPGFPGYPHWWQARGDIAEEANQIAEFVLQRYLPRMN